MAAAKTAGFHYSVKVRIEPELQRLEAEVRIDAPPSRRFRLNRGFTIEHLAADGEAVPFHEDIPEEEGLFDMLGRCWLFEADQAHTISGTQHAGFERQMFES